MKKYLAILVIMICFSSNTQVLAIEQIEFNSGITYNNFVYELTKEGQVDDSYFMREDLHNGVGFYTEGVYWLTDKFGFGIGIDSATATWSGTNKYDGGDTRDFKYTCQLVGPDSKLVYNLNKNINLSTNFIYYNYKEHFQAKYSWKDEVFDEDLDRGKGLGIMLGAKMNYPINNLFSVTSSTYYRKTNIRLHQEYDYVKEELVPIAEDKELNISGLRASLGISYKF